MKKIFALLLIPAVCWLAGCSSVPQVEMKFLNIQKVHYHDSGKLDIRGVYTQKGFGLRTITAEVKGDAVELSAIPAENGKNKISSRITVPPEVKIVRFGGKEIWRRSPAKVPVKNAVGKEKKVAASVPEKASVKAAIPAPAAPAPAASAPAAPAEVRKEPDAEKRSELPEVVTVLQINAEDFFEFKYEEIAFGELFWGSSPKNPSGKSGVKQLGSRKEPVDFNAAEINKFQDLQCLKIKGNTWDSCDFAGLSLPNLKILIIDDIEVKNLDKAHLPALEEFYLHDRRFESTGRITLPEKLERLHSAGIQSFAGNFEFSSLQNKPVKTLRIHSDLKRFDFLKGMPVEKLQLSGFTAAAGSLDILREVPLKSLIIAPYRMNDWNFLAGMKLQKLEILSRTNGNFTPALLKDMPLESLRLRFPPQQYDNEWLLCVGLPLKELVLVNAVVPEKFLLKNRTIESLATVNCRWKFAEPPIIFSRMPELRHLAAWQISYPDRRVFRNDGSPAP